MATLFPDVKDTNLQKLADTILQSMRTPNGTAITTITDRLGNVIQTAGGASPVPSTSQAGPAREVELMIKINPDGLSASAKVVIQTPAGEQSVVGLLDPSLLASHLT